MHRKTLSYFFALAIGVSAAVAHATTPPTPVAVWNEDFSESALTRFPGYTLVDVNNTHGTGYSSVTIDQDNTGLLCNFSNKTTRFTVLVKYTNLAANNQARRVVFATKATNDADRVGVRLTMDASPRLEGLINMSQTVGGDAIYDGETTGSMVFYSEGTMAFIYHGVNGLFVYATRKDEDFPDQEAFGAPGLSFGYTQGFAVGGMCRNAGAVNEAQSAKGMTITGLAVFTNVLSVAQMNAFEWPVQPKLTDTEYRVPYTWFYEYGVQTSEVEATAKSSSSVLKSGGEFYTWWQCYVLGLDPTNEMSRFTTYIRMDGDKPIVEYSPTNEVLTASGSIEYILQGKPALSNGWQDVKFDEPGETNCFFRVKVDW